MTKIASVYFAPVKAERPLYGGYYNIPGVPKGAKPAVVEIQNMVQRSQEPSADGQRREVRKFYDSCTSRMIASDLLREWTTTAVGMGPDCRPGIWIVRDMLPVLRTDKGHEGMPEVDADGNAIWRPGTPEECAAMWAEDEAVNRAAQDKWADFLISEGDKFAINPKERVYISSLMKLAARHYGKQRGWLTELRDGDVKKCQWCTKSIPAEAVICPECSKPADIAKYREMMRQLEGEGDPKLSAEVARLKAENDKLKSKTAA